jgi:hypothetical protein
MISITNNTNFSSFIHRTLCENHLYIPNEDTVIVTGSASISLASKRLNFDKFFDGRSDIDVLIITSDGIDIIRELFPDNVVRAFNDDKINILNYSYQYGQGRNAINIKYIRYANFCKMLSFEHIRFDSYRKESLAAKKGKLEAYGIKRSIQTDYLEEKVEDYFILHYDFYPIVNGNYYLSDIHSMIFFGSIINGKKILSIRAFNNFFSDLLRFSDEELENLFNYFIAKNSIKKEDLRKIIEKFSIQNVGGKQQ